MESPIKFIIDCDEFYFGLFHGAKIMDL